MPVAFRACGDRRQGHRQIQPVQADLLLLVAHGSRDPRSAQHIQKLAGRVHGRRPGLAVEPAFLELSTPLLQDVVRTAYAAGVRQVAVVPVLLGSAFHARVDLPGRLQELSASLPDLRFRVGDVVGSDPAVVQALAQRAAAMSGSDGYLLMATGSTDPTANARVAAIARGLSGRLGAPVQPGFVTAEPGVGESVRALRRAGAGRVGVLPWFLAPGRLLDRGLRQAQAACSRAAGGGTVQVTVAATLADDDLVAEAVLRLSDGVDRVTPWPQGA